MHDENLPRNSMATRVRLLARPPDIVFPKRPYSRRTTITGDNNNRTESEKYRRHCCRRVHRTHTVPARYRGWRLVRSETGRTQINTPLTMLFFFFFNADNATPVKRPLSHIELVHNGFKTQTSTGHRYGLKTEIIKTEQSEKSGVRPTSFHGKFISGVHRLRIQQPYCTAHSKSFGTFVVRYLWPANGSASYNTRL